MEKTHVIIDLYKADPEILAKTDKLQEALLKALGGFKVQVEINSFYQFEPEGVTAIVSSPELHFNIHTWPEHGSCAIDMYCMKGHGFALEVCDAIKSNLKAQEYETKVLKRQKRAEKLTNSK